MGDDRRSGRPPVLPGMFDPRASEPFAHREFAAPTRVRNTDPATSQSAAANIARDAASVRARVLALFERYGDMTHDTVIVRYRAVHDATVKESTIRTRVAELVERAQIVKHGITQNERGRDVTVWGTPERKGIR